MKQFLFLLFVLLCTVSLSYGQQTVSGTVTDDSGQALIGANVVAKEASGIGTITDIDGNFRLQIPANVTTLVFSYAGYETKEMAIAGASVINVSLSEGQLLDEMVVVGYGTQRKTDLTGSISSIKGSEIALAPIQSFDQGLQGRAAGVQITTPNGVLNNPPVIRIRGINSINLSSQPLIVIDGVPTFSGNLRSGNSSASNNPLANINPADIESIEVLKDASASAIYGSRAAAGVIIITTKRGKTGATRVGYDGWMGYSEPVRLFDLLNADEYLEVKNEAARNANLPEFLPSLDVNGNRVDTKWYDHVMRTGFSHNHNLNFSGGNEKTNYFMSVGYTAQEGMIQGNDFSRTNARVNLDHNLLSWVKVGTSLNYTFSENRAPNTGSLDGQAFSTAGLGRVPLITSPIVAPYVNSEGRGSDVPGDGLNYNITSDNQIGPMANGTNRVGFYNPAFILDNNRHSSDNNHFFGNVYIDLELLKGLNFRSNFGIDELGIENQTFWDRRHGDGFPQGGFAENVADKFSRWNFQNTLSYNFNLGTANRFTVLVGAEEQYSSRDRWGAQRIGISDPFFTTFQGNFTTINPAFNFQTENYLTSLLSRLNYSYNDKLFATFNFRRDGFSAFADGKKYGNFYGGSLGYVLSNDAWWQDALGDKVNFFKIRGSYGVVGNNSVDDYASLSLFGSALYGPNPTLQFSQVGNADLTWETSKKLDLGFSAGFLQDKIQLEFAYYKNEIDGLILSVPQAPSKGIPNNLVNANVGNMTNSGIELGLVYNAVRTTNFDWKISANFSTLKNVVNRLGPSGADIAGATATLESSNITRIGEAVGSLYAVETAGVNPENGRRIFLLRDNVNNAYAQVQYNHAAPSASRWTYVNDYRDFKAGDVSAAPSLANSGQIYGPTLPTYYGGFDNQFRYKNFDVNVMFQFQGGNYIYNGTKAGLRDMRFWNNHTDVLDRWTEENTDGTIPRVVLNDNVSNGSAFPISENVEKGDFVRLRNVGIGYKLPSSLISKAKISNVRVYGQVQNALLFTDYSGSDPEISTNGASNITPGVDRNSVGQGRVYTIGAQVGF